MQRSFLTVLKALRRGRVERALSEEAMAADSVVGCTDLPMKRAREDEENGVSAASTVSVETEGNNNEHESISTVIPGWFSEISPMWPGEFYPENPFM